MAYLPILAQVQELENRWRVLERIMEQLKQDPKLAPLETMQKGLEIKLVELVAKQQKSQRTVREMEFDLKEAEARVSQVEAKLYGGSVSNIRELNQLQQKNVEDGKSKLKVEEDLLELMEQDERLIRENEILRKRQKQVAAEILSLREGSREQLAELNLELETIKLQLPELFTKLPVEWLERYRKLAKQRNGVGLANIKGTSCGACHVTLPDGLLQQVKRGEDRLLYCDNCGRILYYC